MKKLLHTSEQLIFERIRYRSENCEELGDGPRPIPAEITISVDRDSVVERIRSSLVNADTLAAALTEITTYYPVQVYEFLVDDPGLTTMIISILQGSPSESLLRALAKFLSVSQTLIRKVFTCQPRLVGILQQCLTPAVTPPQILAALDFIDTIVLKGGTFGITLVATSRLYDSIYILAKNVKETHARIIDIISKCVHLDPVYGMHTFAEEASTSRKMTLRALT